MLLGIIAAAVGLAALALALAALRLRAVLRPRAQRRAGAAPLDEPCSALVVLGSGGHTAEMLALLRGMDRHRFAPLHVVVADTDSTSLPKLQTSYPDLADRVTVHVVRRSREVGQSFAASVWPTLRAAAESVRLVASIRPQLVLCNGPGTCVPVCFGALLVRFLALGDPCIIFVESFCRVKTLSLTGRILYPLADRFVVQWPALAERFERAEYIGVLF